MSPVAPNPPVETVGPAEPAKPVGPVRSSGPGLPALDVGRGPPIVILHGYALPPRVYRVVAGLLTGRARVVVPDLFAVPGRWSYESTLAAIWSTLDRLGLDRVTLVGHSFGGGFELGLAAHRPERITELVFADTLGLSREWVLAEEATHPVNLLRLAWPPAVAGFARSWATRPMTLARAAWWGFTSDRRAEVGAIAGAGLPSHVLWASRDTLLCRQDGQEFADDLGATFTVVTGPDGARPVDHDWMYRHPALFVDQLGRLGLAALAPDGSPAG